MIFLRSYSILTWLTMALTSVIITPFFLLVWLCTFWWDRRKVAAHMMGTFWAWHYQSLVPAWHLRIEGREKIPCNQAVVLVANHRSFIDILALYKIRRPFRWTSKDENFRLPFVGMVLSLSGAIRIKRGSLRSGNEFIKQAEKAIQEGSSVLIFPEGTRSKKPVMRSFMEGAFFLAKKMEVPIIPIVHNGTQNCFRKDSKMLISRADIRIRILDEVDAKTVNSLELSELTALVRGKMEEGLEQLT